MNPPKEISVFSIGDSRQLKTWSNVPYFFTKNLEDKQIKVNRINLQENHFLSQVYKYSLYPVLKLFYKNSYHTYFRSGLNYYLTNLKIKKAISDFPEAEQLIFLTYSFSAKQFSSKKVILFSDWSYLYLIKNFLKRKPFWFEKNALKRERMHIQNADFVISLFPRSLQFNLNNYTGQLFFYLGNVINSNFPLIKDDLFRLKKSSPLLLFIGNKKYLNGAIDLIAAFKEITGNGKSNIELHLVGLHEKDLNINIPGLYYHGYLDKSIPEQNFKYYQLITKAKAVINTTSNWGAFSAMTEAMYYYTPVITTAYDEFTETYGKTIDFGYYVPDNSSQELINCIKTLLQLTQDQQEVMMTKAHEKVKNFTWTNYIDKYLEITIK